MLLPGISGAIAGISSDGAPAGDYATHVVGATNKTLWLRANSLVLSNNDPVDTWGDEASANNFTSSGVNRPTFKTNQLNGLPSVYFNADDKMASAITLSTVLGGDRTRTVFIVGRSAGAQNGTGGGSGNSGYDNPAIVTDSGGYWGMHLRSRQLVVNNYSNNSDFSGIDYIDNIAFVWAHRVDGSGNIRRSLSGSVTTASPAWTTPSSVTGTMKIGANYADSAGRWLLQFDLFEVLIVSDSKSDTDMDNIVNGLKAKWGIA